ncbi:MAG: glutaredoxin 3 [Proteobacteria bacterium]|nr:glutaredoxin 3 [Pseudomonadota bacterium]
MKKQADAARLAAANEAGPRVEVYHKTWCSYSRAALALLREKGVRFEDIDITDDDIRERQMIERAHAASVPQIFVDGESIGGYDELAALDDHGLLDELLGRGLKLPRAA